MPALPGEETGAQEGRGAEREGDLAYLLFLSTRARSYECVLSGVLWGVFRFL